MLIAFVVHALEPWTTAWEAEYDLKLFSEREREQGYFVKFNMNALLRGDMQARAAFYESGIANRWLKPSEARSKEDLPRDDTVDDAPQQPTGGLENADD
jgi:HK97 family phage portal protein